MTRLETVEMELSKLRAENSELKTNLQHTSKGNAL